MPGMTTSVNSKCGAVAAIREVERLFGTGGGNHRVAQIAQRLDGHAAHALLILDDENDFPIARRRLRLARRTGAGLLGTDVARQIDAHRRSLAELRIDLDVAVRLLDEAVYLGQARDRCPCRCVLVV